MQDDTVWYFAYGSNLDSDRLHKRIGRDRVDSKVGYLRDYRFAFNKKGNDGSGKANIVPRGGSQVWGAVYRLTSAELSYLDRCEGVPGHYERRQVEVMTREGEIIHAQTYIANREKVSAGLRPTREYLDHILKGAKEHGLPAEYVEEIRRCSEGRSE
ncbi:MAG: gamma-glutamylcyclotransferase family protein [Armatimonadota bacterium]|nr:gamma-glutamylcyclotransferase family protein [Armatimonadota bacterium]MDR7444695.1 gamma-glutamylcyclotransferase family protein [Armatimonadota bacterium]MDR7613301.1 gamma-glutamylcyclotransferase family protein [Armatimonadota bacterium]